MARALIGFGLNTWYFITADYAFGWSLEENASSAVKAAGGRVIGRSRHPLGTSNFGEFLTDLPRSQVPKSLRLRMPVATPLTQ